MRIRRENAWGGKGLIMGLVINSYLTVYDGILFNQSSYKLNNTIWGSVAFRMRSPSFSTYRGNN